MQNYIKNYIPRELEVEIKPFLPRKEVLAIVGARQVGKTTFLQYLFDGLQKTKKKTAFLTFEREKDLALFENIEDFKEYYNGYDVIFIDEFHYAKEGGKKLKYLFDTTKTKFIISGSSSLELTFSTGKYLVGRMVKFTLTPFSFREFLLAKDEKLAGLLNLRFRDILKQFNPKKAFGEELNLRLEKYLEEYILFGGYPAVVLSKTQNEKIKIIEGILENYLLRDIKALLNLKTQAELLKMATFLAGQVGNLLNYQELANVSGLSYKTVLEHLAVLEQTFTLNLLKPFYKNPRTELVKTPKVFFVDTGFRNYLLSDFKPFEQRNDAGSLAENFVFSQLARREVKTNFWRSKSKAEVDFILEKDSEITPIEVKYSKTASPGKSFFSFLEKFSPKKGYFLSRGLPNIKTIKQTKIFFAPVYYL
ncbi:hypothetical protein COT20_02015 [bacterium (Candidatus Gribaldobacteria) CG08_land_8_20_14_0_20_39_15]|uniref:AAA+ ATPase domain-containing protein n=1 Tax=bacterium (Candidatus Gribaldobacteria) CG08_land_8_20_14_0_20_39_15 TaxID=2014273 RepID=A0A2M6XUF7_9BACT|nr:MAG: hypothetical protein COT20_02015 [bacterium (Candidatus Gribaldobacteria) CG08_land_8_20_14_0_20_39_15]